MKQLICGKAFLKFVERNKVHDMYQEHWRLMLPFTDAILIGMMRMSRSAQEALPDFLARVAPLMYLLFEKEHVQKVWHCEGNYMSVSEELAALTSRWRFGRAIFYNDLCCVVQQQLDVHIGVCINKCFVRPGENAS